MDWRSFEKTFNIKIPIFEHADYYINCLKQSLEFKDIENNIDMFKNYEKTLNISIKQNKQEWITTTKKYLEEIKFLETVRNWTVPNNFKFVSKNFTPKEDQLYLSVDINEANWTVSKYMINFNLPNWETFTSNLGYPKILSKSKNFRQYVLGNTLPNKFSKMQQVLTNSHISMLKDFSDIIIEFISEDEIIINVSNISEIEKIMNLNWSVPVKKKIFSTKYINNFDDNVRVDCIKDIQNNQIVDIFRKLKNVPSNRFYIHFKTLILEQELDDRDLLFKVDKHIAKWII